MAAGEDIRLHGKNGAIYINGGKPGGAYGSGTKLAGRTEWSLNLNRDFVDATAFGDRNKRYLVGLKDISGTYAGHLDTSGDLGVHCADLDEIPVYLYADDREGEEIVIAFGLGFLDASISGSNTDSLKSSGNFRAAGNWTVFPGVVFA
jgi:hypothetical protein